MNLDTLKKALSFGTRSYFLGITVWLLLWLTIKDGWWPLVLVNRLVFYLFAPLPVLLLANLALRQWRLLGWLVFPAALFGYLYAPYVIPTPAQAIEPNMSVLTYNVLYSNQDYNAAASVIRTNNPDFVMLQEVRPEMFVELETRLADDYPYAQLGGPHDYGTTAVFSRHPFVESYSLDLENDRPATVAVVEFGGERLMLISAHLNPYGLQYPPLLERPAIINERTRTQNRQAEVILETIAQFDGAVLLGCDCNSVETSETMRMLSQEMTIGQREAGLRGNGWTVADAEKDDGLRRIDYVLYRGDDLRPTGAYLLNGWGGSDHAPASVRFATGAN